MNLQNERQGKLYKNISLKDLLDKLENLLNKFDPSFHLSWKSQDKGAEITIQTNIEDKDIEDHFK